MTLRILIVLAIKMNWNVILVDVEEDFLEGTLEEEIFVELPEGLEHFQNVKKNDIGLLNKALYGLVQAARQFYKEIIDNLTTEQNFIVSKCEPCLLMNHEVIVGLYVDDLLMIGNSIELQKVVNHLKK